MESRGGTSGGGRLRTGNNYWGRTRDKQHRESGEEEEVMGGNGFLRVQVDNW